MLIVTRKGDFKVYADIYSNFIYYLCLFWPMHTKIICSTTHIKFFETVFLNRLSYSLVCKSFLCDMTEMDSA